MKSASLRGGHAPNPRQSSPRSTCGYHAVPAVHTPWHRQYPGSTGSHPGTLPSDRDGRLRLYACSRRTKTWLDCSAIRVRSSDGIGAIGVLPPINAGSSKSSRYCRAVMEWHSRVGKTWNLSTSGRQGFLESPTTRSAKRDTPRVGDGFLDDRRLAAEYLQESRFGRSALSPECASGHWPRQIVFVFVQLRTNDAGRRFTFPHGLLFTPGGMGSAYPGALCSGMVSNYVGALTEWTLRHLRTLQFLQEGADLPRSPPVSEATWVSAREVMRWMADKRPDAGIPAEVDASMERVAAYVTRRPIPCLRPSQERVSAGSGETGPG